MSCSDQASRSEQAKTAETHTRDAGLPATTSPWRAIDHVQLAIPQGGEDVAREFFTGQLGIPEVPKPPALAARGGCWFETGDVRIHVGVEDDFRPALKAHPALRVAGLAALVERAGLDITWSHEIPGVERGFVADPFGNRIELIEAESSEDDP